LSTARSRIPPTLECTTVDAISPQNERPSGSGAGKIKRVVGNRERERERERERKRNGGERK